MRYILLVLRISVYIIIHCCYMHIIYYTIRAYPLFLRCIVRTEYTAYYLQHNNIIYAYQFTERTMCFLLSYICCDVKQIHIYIRNEGGLVAFCVVQRERETHTRARANRVANWIRNKSENWSRARVARRTVRAPMRLQLMLLVAAVAVSAALLLLLFLATVTMSNNN